MIIQYRRPSFFFIMAIVSVLVVFTGFFKTFLIPFSAGKSTVPAIVHFHGALSFAWILFFLLQNFLIHRTQYRLHMALGILGLFIAFGMAFTIIPAALFQAERELKEGLGQTAISGIVGSCTSGIIFFALVIAGLLNRNNAAAHKRLMLLATIVVLWPAWFRFRHYFPSVPRPDIWFAVVLADSLIVIAIIRDKLTYRKIHPVLLYVGLFIIAEHAFEVMMFDSAGWRVVANFLINQLAN